MQLKGLVRFFTILLIIYSVYQLHFTWVVRSHEKKMAAIAQNYVNSNYPSSLEKYPDNKDSQAVHQEFLDKLYQERLKRLLDSTRDVTLTYGPTGKLSYKQAKESELNLGLDLQGGMNVTLEVEMSGLLRALSNNSKEPAFLQALQEATVRKANSNADFITLFVEEYRKRNPTGRLASLFAAANPDKIKIDDSDGKVISVLRSEATDAFERTYRVLRTRIDQFGVAQPSINPDPDRGIITVELPGVQDKERVRKILQSSANLQFWEVYNLSELAQNIQAADDAFFAMMGGKSDVPDTVGKKQDDTEQKNPSDPQKDTGTVLSKKLSGTTDDTSEKEDLSQDLQDDSKKRLNAYIGFSIDQQGRPFDNGRIGVVSTRDTGYVRQILNRDAIRMHIPSEVVWMYGMPEDESQKKANIVPLYAIKTFGRDKAKLEGDAITSASQDYDQQGRVEVKMSMNSSGARIWAELTRENVGKFIAIALDNLVYSCPRVNDVIEGGNSSITGNFTEQEAQDLANILKAGKLPAPAKIVQEQQVGPTLGKEAIRSGSTAFFISFVVIFLLMLVYYNTSGWIANIALILNLLFTVGVLTGLGATLTAPGIAGLVLTIGMAVDTNVIIFERIKEELMRGKGYLPAISDGYRRSLPPVLDAHITTLMTAIILFYFGLGPVKGFATTQILGLLLSMFCGILVSRWITEWFTNKKRHLEYFTKVSKSVFKQAKFKFIEYRKYAYIVTVVVLLAGTSAFFNGFDQGVEFKGGRSYTIRFSKPVNVEQVRTEVRNILEGDNPVIKTVGDNRTLDITTAYLISDTRREADSLVAVKLFDGIKAHLPQGLTFEEFYAGDQYIAGTKKVLPSISEDLKQGAVKATIFAIMVIFIYIFIRFRDWRYSLGTIVALLHDVMITLAVFSFARAFVPFPLEIDQHFIAAILTVIGFSMNDTIIVFDRIREYSRELRDVSKTTVINRAINDTLSRTIMTSLTVFIVILILFLVGGEVTRGFAFAMLIGIVTGTYSSIFVAAPVLVDLAKNKPLGKADTVAKTVHQPNVKPVVPKAG
jgi:SecD/SecF fusion protein